MSLETRSMSAINKRAEQLKRWFESETNREPTSPKTKSRKIQFSPGCVFLAACAAADKDEVQFLLNQGSDINTTNVDGLTALHQACIDNNLDMVEFLVKNGANINQGDNEGWTPLHATASCGFSSIAKFLLDHGANIAAVNNDGDLAYDICFMSAEIYQLLGNEMKNRDVNDDEARSKEERQMLEDVNIFLKSNENQSILSIHPKTGATSLHVAASKGYLKVLEQLLISNRLDIDQQDFDGWTALHAASYWGQLEACELLIKHHADTEIKNHLNQTVFDIAKDSVIDHLRKCCQEQDKGEVQRRKLQRKRVEAKIRPIDDHLEIQLTPNKVKKVQHHDGNVIEMVQNHVLESQMSSESDSYVSDHDENETVIINSNKVVQSKSAPNSNSNVIEPSSVPTKINSAINDFNESIVSPLPKVISANEAFLTNSHNNNNNNSNSNGKIIDEKPPVPVQPQLVSWKRPTSLTNRLLGDSKIKVAGEDGISASQKPGQVVRPSLADSDVSLRRTQSFESDKKFYLRYLELHARIKASSNPVILSPPPSSTNTKTTTTATTIATTVPERLFLTTVTTTIAGDNLTSSQSTIPHLPSFPSSPNIINSNNNNLTINDNRNFSHPNHSTYAVATTSVNTAAASTTNSTTSSTNVYCFGCSDTNSNHSNINDTKTEGFTQNVIKRSFVPPARDEESETQRKAHSKRVRETRRSTQGVTLDEIKSAEELMKKQQQQQQPNQSKQNDVSVTVPIPSTLAQQNNSKNSDESAVVQDKRPSWRLRVDNGSKFALEDASKEPIPTYSSTSIFNRRHSSLLSNNRPISTSTSSLPTSVHNSTAANNIDLTTNSVNTTVTLPAHKCDDGDNHAIRDTDNCNNRGDVRPISTTVVSPSAVVGAGANLATQAAIQRRRRPKRRSTGVVHVDLDDIINSDNNNENGQLDNNKESGDDNHRDSCSKVPNNEAEIITKSLENGDILDYKKLWEESQFENGKLKEKLRKTEDELRDANEVLNRINSVTSKSSLSLSELEKREKRAMERKLSEMEEELKQLQKLKAENERLRTENKALTRVVNKLSNSTIK